MGDNMTARVKGMLLAPAGNAGSGAFLDRCAARASYRTDQLWWTTG
jgi:hypothetical protein